MSAKNIVSKATASALAAALAACCAPAWSLAAEQGQVATVAEECHVAWKVYGSFDSCVGKSTQLWRNAPLVRQAYAALSGSGSTASSLASYRALFNAVCSYGSELLAPYEDKAPVLLEDGFHYRMGADTLEGARAAIETAQTAARDDTCAAYYDQSRTVIGALNNALCDVEPAPDADALKLIWDGRALKQVADKKEKLVRLGKSAVSTAKAYSVSLAAPLSQSGATPVYSTMASSARLSVSKGGKVTLSNKAGRGIYRAWVRVTYSPNTTKLVEVFFEVR